MADWAVYLTNDVMGTLSFSNPFGPSTSGEHRWILQAVPLSTRLRYACCFEPWLLTSGVDRWLYPQLDQWRARIRAFSSAMLQRRVDRQDDKTLHDFFRFILDAPDAKTGGPVDARTLASESSLLVNAGGDSIGTAIAATTFPSGVELAVSPYAIHRNKEYYPDPLTYKPERWLVDNVGAEVGNHTIINCFGAEKHVPWVQFREREGNT